MPSYNKAILIGRLTRDPELKYSSTGMAIASFSIAVDRAYKDKESGEKKVDFFKCSAFRNTAEFVSNYIQKGRLVCVEGRHESNEVTDESGNSKVYWGVVVDNVSTLDSRPDGGEDGNQQAPRQQAAVASTGQRQAAAKPARTPVPAVAAGDYLEEDDDPFSDE
jgi:single-strand DNA-binding protein